MGGMETGAFVPDHWRGKRVLGAAVVVDSISRTVRVTYRVGGEEVEDERVLDDVPDRVPDRVPVRFGDRAVEGGEPRRAHLAGREGRRWCWRTDGPTGPQNRRRSLAFLGRSCSCPAVPSGSLVGRAYRRRARDWIAARAE